MSGRKTTMLRVRLTESEQRYLMKKADALGISISDFVRRRLFETAPRLNDMEGLALNGHEVEAP